MSYRMISYLVSKKVVPSTSSTPRRAYNNEKSIFSEGRPCTHGTRNHGAQAKRLNGKSIIFSRSLRWKLTRQLFSLANPTNCLWPTTRTGHLWIRHGTQKKMDQKRRYAKRERYVQQITSGIGTGWERRTVAFELMFSVWPTRSFKFRMQ